MLLRYFYDPKLAQASYFVGCQATGEALVVDPNRDLEPYLTLAAHEGMRVVAITETHIHADFVSGARELADRTGATLYLSDEGGPDWLYQFPHTGLRDGDSFMVGNIRLEALHTPGHTPEHLIFALTDTRGADEPMGLFTGDLLFAGDIGRPDLLEEAAGIANTKEAGAHQLFASLQRLRALPEYLQIWPGHGAGSACGKALGAVPSTTLGYEMRFNWAFRETDEATFVGTVLSGQPEPPRYFAQMKRINRAGPPVRHGLPTPPELSLDSLTALLDKGATVVDTRPWASYRTGHLPGTLSIPLSDSFTTWAGTVLPYDQPLYLLVEEAHQQGVLKELGRIGLDEVAGVVRPFLLAHWPGALEQLPEVSPTEFGDLLASGTIYALDVRRVAEYEEGHIPTVPNLPLQKLPDRLDTVPRDKPLYLHCRSGARSALAASYLQSQGIKNVVNVQGGILAWEKAGGETTGDRK